MIIEKKSKTADIRIENDLIEGRSQEFVDSMKRLISEEIKRFNLDFTDLSFIDSYALSNLIIFCDKSDLEFSFKNVNKSLMNIFEIIKLNKLVLFE
ncbi:MAG: STAS domain-containing protein [Candidatus Delongbacteria bacterium]|nr:STAS domain-containing protein [Candidatus Delongbacteria bacterium]